MLYYIFIAIWRQQMTNKLTNSNLTNSNYSPISWTPASEVFISGDENAPYYFNLIKQLLIRINKSYEKRFSIHYTGGTFRISYGLEVVVTVPNVDSSLKLSNIYHLLKLYQEEVADFVYYLEESGIPTLVEAVRTGYTPSVYTP